MGANLDCRIYKSKDEMTKRWKHDVEADLHENGHSYSGTIGQLTAQLPKFIGKAATVEAAIDMIDEKHEKWNPAVAVLVADGKVVVGGWCSS